MRRKSTGKKLRFEVLKRDKFECQYCGAHPPKVLLVLDHITPVAEGGETVIDNLITACEPCNQGKGARPLSNIPESLSSKAERVAEVEEQIRGYQEIMRAKAERLEDDVWSVAEIMWPKCTEPGNSIKQADFLSIKNFVDKLGLAEVDRLAEVALGRNARRGPWLYFCGCCWKAVRGESQ